jgi:hypothetical protein
MATVTVAPAVKKDSTPLDVLNFIQEAKTLWGKINHLAIGRIFSKLKARTENYQRDEKGMTYHQAVKATTVPWSSAEFYRNMAETCDAAKLSEAIFLALNDSGVNLASERYLPAIKTKAVKELDANDEAAVKALVVVLKTTYAKPPAKATTKPSDAQLLARLEKDRADIAATIKNTSSERAKETLEEELESLDEDVLEIRTNLRTKIEKAAVELTSLISQATSMDELPEASFWSTLLKKVPEVASKVQATHGLTNAQTKEFAGMVTNLYKEIATPKVAAKPKNGKAVHTATFPSKKVPVGQPQA